MWLKNLLAAVLAAVLPHLVEKVSDVSQKLLQQGDRKP